MFEARVFRIMIGCPSDIKEEVNIARKVIFEWSNLYAESTEIVLLPLHWSFNSYPAQGEHPQKIINQQLVEKSDLLICIFNSTLGTPTTSEESGTIEEIIEHVKTGKQVMVFFKTKVDITNIQPEELKRLKHFKETISKSVLWQEYDDENSFENIVQNKLQLFINNNWLRKNLTSNRKDMTHQIFSEEEIERLKKWTNADSPEFYRVDFSDGSAIFGLGAENQYQINPGRDMAKWNSFMDRLLKNEFIKISKYDKQGHPKYELQLKAYEYIDEIDSM